MLVSQYNIKYLVHIHVIFTDYLQYDIFYTISNDECGAKGSYLAFPVCARNDSMLALLLARIESL